MYEKKIMEAKDAFNILANNKLYSSAANRAYYHCYIGIMKYIEENNILVKNENNSHEDNIEAVRLTLATIDSLSAMDFNKSMKVLKRLRVRADYSDIQITSDDMSTCRMLMTAVTNHLENRR